MVDFGYQPVASHFTEAAEGPFGSAGLGLAVCDGCGIIQLAPPFPRDLLVPAYEWVSYREPEDHLDDVAETIGGLTEIAEGTFAYGLSFKDRSTLDRLVARGAGRIAVIHPVTDLGATDRNAGVETIQELISEGAARSLVARHGPADIVVARHILEHAGQPAKFLDSVEEMLRPGGLLVIEVPDCARSLALKDFTMLWEEHSLYFTEDTLPQALKGRGFRIRSVERHTYAFEDVLVLYAQQFDGVIDQSSTGIGEAAASGPSLQTAKVFAASFQQETERLEKILTALRSRGQLALYGAGHLTCTFVSIHRLAKYFAFIVDDMPEKQGLYLPGTGIEIVPRDRLPVSGVTACLFGLSPELEDRIIANNAPFIECGGEFFSIFAASPRSVRELGQN